MFCIMCHTYEESVAVEKNQDIHSSIIDKTQFKSRYQLVVVQVRVMMRIFTRRCYSDAFDSEVGLK